jgi:fibrillarin-like pre-rRNA processing protein
MKIKRHKVAGVYVLGKELATKGEALYGERTFDGYRLWSPQRSKLAALLMKQAAHVHVAPEQVVLYLGAASGTTVSHLADIVSLVYAVEFAPRVARDLVLLSERVKNIIPLISDAAHPDYGSVVELVDLLYQDIAQPRQAEIALKNAELFLKPRGDACIMIKARSIDVAAKPKTVYKREVKKLEELFEIEGVHELEPFYKAHAAVIARLA